MAKFTHRFADSPDDPIFTERFVISSSKSNRGSKQSTKNLPTSTAGSTGEAILVTPEKCPDLQNLPLDIAEEVRKRALKQRQ
jgi:hypothetical protein